MNSPALITAHVRTGNRTAHDHKENRALHSTSEHSRTVDEVRTLTVEINTFKVKNTHVEYIKNTSSDRCYATGVRHGQSHRKQST